MQKTQGRDDTHGNGTGCTKKARGLQHDWQTGGTGGGVSGHDDTPPRLSGPPGSARFGPGRGGPLGRAAALEKPMGCINSNQNLAARRCRWAIRLDQPRGKPPLAWHAPRTRSLPVRHPRGPLLEIPPAPRRRGCGPKEASARWVRVSPYEGHGTGTAAGIHVAVSWLSRVAESNDRLKTIRPAPRMRRRKPQASGGKIHISLLARRTTLRGGARSRRQRRGNDIERTFWQQARASGSSTG
jgi:hypothetical protein